MMGGSGAHEYMAPCDAGENEVALAPGYAANIEVASAVPQPVELPPPLDAPREAPTPGLTTVEDVAERARRARRRPDQGDAGRRRGRGPGHGPGPRRPPAQRDQARQPPRRRRPARRGRRRSRTRSARSASSARSARTCAILMDEAISGAGLVARREPARRPPDRGRARPRLRPTRPATCAPSRPGDTTPSGDPIEIETAIEVGNIFKLGTRYSEPLGATYLDPDGVEQPIVMGSYGIGPARIVAAAVEQRADEKGICWPPSIAPWQVHVVRARQGRRRGRRRRRRALRGARRRPGSRRCSTIAPRPAPARSSPTPS